MQTILNGWELVEEPNRPAWGENGDKWVKIVAHIRKNATGEIRKSPSTAVLDAGASVPSQFWWEEGNACCDCNRELFFERAGGVECETEHCSHDRFSVNLENPVDGSIWYREFED